MELFLSRREYDILRDIKTLRYIFSKLNHKMYFKNIFLKFQSFCAVFTLIIQ